MVKETKEFYTIVTKNSNGLIEKDIYKKQWFNREIFTIVKRLLTECA